MFKLNGIRHAIIIGTQGKICLQIGADAEPGRRNSGQQSVFSVWKRFKSAIQDCDARELSICMAYEINDPETSRGMRGGDILRPSCSLEKAQYICLWLREQTSWMQHKTLRTSVSTDASQKRSRQGDIRIHGIF